MKILYICIMYGILEIQMDKYLCQFMRRTLREVDGAVELDKSDWFGSLLYNCMEHVPEDCWYVKRDFVKKDVLRVRFGQLRRGETGRTGAPKSWDYDYYIPHSKQVFIEKYVRDWMENVLCSFIDLNLKFTGMEIKDLIDIFCQHYNIDFGTYYETFKKKYYRYRKPK